MNIKEINKTFFEDLHQIQMNQINTSILKDARKIILNLLLYAQSGAMGDEAPGRDEAVLNALEWLKNNQS